MALIQHSIKHSIKGLGMVALATAGLVAVLSPAQAQTSTSADPLQGLGGAGDRTDLSNPFDLFHRAVLAPSLTSGEFQAQQQQRILTEAEAYRQRQQEVLRLEFAPAAPLPTVEDTRFGEETLF